MISGTPCWDYDDRRTCQEVVSRVWLGPYTVGKDAELLSSMKVTDIILVRATEGVECNLLKARSPDFQYHVFEMTDSKIHCSLKVLSTFSELLTSLTNHHNKRILVLGLTGMNRSCALLAAYLMRAHSLSAQQALEYIASRRRCASVSETLKRQLWELEIFANQSPSSVSRLKRGRNYGVYV